MIIKLTIGILAYILFTLITMCLCIVIITKTLNFLSKSFVGIPLNEACHRFIEKDNPKEIKSENTFLENKQEYIPEDTIAMCSLEYNPKTYYLIETIDCKQYLFEAEDLNQALTQLRNYTTKRIFYIEKEVNGYLEKVYSIGDLIEMNLEENKNLSLGFTYAHFVETEPISIHHTAN